MLELTTSVLRGLYSLVAGILSFAGEFIAAGLLADSEDEDTQLKLNASSGEHNCYSMFDDPFDDPDRYY